MAITGAMCTTCLSDTIDGIAIPATIAEFLQNILGFQCPLRRGRSKSSLICLSCYRTLCEMKRFYVKLQEVEHYFNEEVVKDLRSAKSSKRRSKKAAKRNGRVNWTKDNEVFEDVAVETNIKVEALEGSYRKTVNNQETIKCGKCYRIFDDTETYKRHLPKHRARRGAGEKKYKCGSCAKLFATIKGKRSHEVIHTNLRPYKCDLCIKTFRYSSVLVVHRTLHTGKLVECIFPECGKRFSTKFMMLKHSKVHGNFDLYNCAYCSAIFPSAEKLQDHKLTHGDQYKCDIGNETFCKKETLEVHVTSAHKVDTNTTAILDDITDELPMSPLDVKALPEEILG